MSKAHCVICIPYNPMSQKGAEHVKKPYFISCLFREPIECMLHVLMLVYFAHPSAGLGAAHSFCGTVALCSDAYFTGKFTKNYHTSEQWKDLYPRTYRLEQFTIYLVRNSWKYFLLLFLLYCILYGSGILK